MRIDLHAHSTASDGTDRPGAVMQHAAAAGLDVVALTDHDTTAGWAEASRDAPPGLTMVPGAEISCAVGEPGALIPIHLLGYLFDPTADPLADELALIRTDRERRGAAMVDRLVALGVDVSWAQVEQIAAGGSVGRPHVAQAMVDAGVVSDIAGAFTDEWIGNGGRAHVEKRHLDPVEAVQLVAAAGGVSVMAHPGAIRRGPLVDDGVIAAMAEAGLAGLEVDHPDHDPATRDRYRSLAGDLRLLVTGSSDDHGTRTGRRLGSECTDPGVWAELQLRASGVAPVRRG